MSTLDDVRSRPGASAPGQGGAADQRSMREIIGAVIDDGRNLIRGEIQLARAELDEKIERLVMAVVSVVAGILLAVSALNLVLAALVAALDESGLGLPTWAAAAIVAVVVALAGFSLVKAGQKNLSFKKLMPERTAANLEADARLVRNQA